MRRSIIPLQTALLFALVLVDFGAAAPTTAPADFGIVPNGKEDQTAAIQKYLDAIASAGGGTARLDPGQYVIRGSLRVPSGVLLLGAWEMPHHAALTRGTVLMAYGGRGKEDGPALIELSPDTGVKGITICYPEQTVGEVQPYPWSIHGAGMHNTVENVTLVNSYQGIAIGPQSNELHLIRNVYGCVLRRGVFIDNTTDIGRIENVHFNPHYWFRSGLATGRGRNQSGAVIAYMQQNLEAFIFGRSDWQSVRDCFVFGARVGYHFIATRAGACNGQLSGIGADACQYDVMVDAAQGPGILISNGQFVSLKLQPNAEPRIGIVTGKGFNAALQLTNCSFWGDFTSFGRFEGNGMVSITQARMEGNKGPAIEILGGRAVVRDVLFRNRGTHVVIGKDVKRVVVETNFAEGGVKVQNEAGERAVIKDNE